MNKILISLFILLVNIIKNILCNPLIDNNCLKKTSFGECLECKLGYGLNNNNCFNCGVFCNKCFFDENQKPYCNECKSPDYKVKEGICIKSNENNNNFFRMTESCSNNCNNCYLDEGKEVCLQCKSGFILFSGTCYQEEDDNKNDCLYIVEHCIKCINNVRCKECSSYFKLKNGKCIEDNSFLAVPLILMIFGFLALIFAIVMYYKNTFKNENANNTNNQRKNINIRNNNNYIIKNYLMNTINRDSKSNSIFKRKYNQKSNDIFNSSLDNNKNECNICLENKQPLMHFKCGCSLFVCKDCYNKCKRQNNKCPGCRAVI